MLRRWWGWGGRRRGIDLRGEGRRRGGELGIKVLVFGVLENSKFCFFIAKLFG